MAGVGLTQGLQVRRLGRLRTTVMGGLLVVLAGCAAPPVPAAKVDGSSRLELLDGNRFKRVVLTARAAEQIGLQTAPVMAIPASGPGGGRLALPRGALLYESSGTALVYTNSEPLAFVGHPVVIESIDGERAVLSEGPPPGTQVVIVGAAELFGIEFGVGK